MIFLVRCPTCYRTLSTNMDQQMEEKSRIWNNDRLTQKEKEERGKEVLDKHGHKIYCCRMRSLTTVPFADVIV